MPRARLLTAAFACLLALPGRAQMPVVQARRLANGARILVVDRPGSGWVQAQLVLRDGGEAWGAHPDAGAWVARALFEGMTAADLRPDPALDTLLQQWEGAREGLAGLQAQRARGGEAGTSQADLEALHQRLTRELAARLEASPDPLEALGVVAGPLRVEPDGIRRSLAVPSLALGPWLGLERARLAQLRLTRLPLLPPHPPDPHQQVLDHALATAFPGHPLTPSCPPETRPGQSEARALARQLTAPDRLILVLVGDVRAEAALALAERELGSLAAPPSAAATQPHREPPRAAVGGRRLSLVWEGLPRLAMAWPMPAPEHRDYADLRLLTALLAEGPAATLQQVLVGGGLARDLHATWLHLGTGGGGLWVVEAVPEEGRSLPELSLALEGELRRLFTEQPPAGRVDGRRRRNGLLDALIGSEPAALAEALAEAQARTGDPAHAFEASRAEAQALPSLARTYLHPDLRTEVFLDTDPDSALRDPLDRKLSEALRRIAGARNASPAQVEAQVTQALRQLRMLGRAERESVLRLLEATGARR